MPVNEVGLSFYCQRSKRNRSDSFLQLDDHCGMIENVSPIVSLCSGLAVIWGLDSGN